MYGICDFGYIYGREGKGGIDGRHADIDRYSTTPSSLTPSATPFSLSSRPGMSGRLSPGAQPQNAASPVPWRRANVRHTSNELYVDIVETLDVVLAPSGRPLSAIANGTIAFTAKVSGVPDLFLQLGCPGGISNTLSLPVFHPCVRLKRWSERPGELSFVPPDGRFILAGYEVDLLGPAALNAFSKDNSKAAPKLNIPATVAIITSLGPSGADFEVRLSLNPRYAGKPSTSPLPSATGSSFPRTAGLGRGLNGPTQGTTAAPSVEEVVVHIPLPASVKNIADLRVSKGAGEAGYAPGERSIEWRINSRDVGHLMARDRGVGTGAVATLYGTVVGLEDNGDGLEGGPVSLSNTSNPYDYDDGATSSYQSPPPSEKESRFSSQRQGQEADEEQKKRVKRNKVLMPSCAAVSFSVKGWLPSGIKVESLAVDAQRSRGLGQGVTPYKGVKYVCVSRRGVECRG